MSREREGTSSPGPDGYEAPAVEQVLSPADLEREILYAGQDAQSDTDS
ncbi:MAG TPA: hypothetical protein VIE44_10320 [Methylomirabilota bacterium]